MNQRKSGDDVGKTILPLDYLGKNHLLQSCFHGAHHTLDNSIRHLRMSQNCREHDPKTLHTIKESFSLETTGFLRNNRLWGLNKDMISLSINSTTTLVDEIFVAAATGQTVTVRSSTAMNINPLPLFGLSNSPAKSIQNFSNIFICGILMAVRYGSNCIVF